MPFKEHVSKMTIKPQIAEPNLFLYRFSLQYFPFFACPVNMSPIIKRAYKFHVLYFQSPDCQHNYPLASN